jgi:hypothetical protein
MTIRSWVTVTVTIFALALCGVARAADEKKEDEGAKKIKESDVPAKVMSTVKEKFPKAKIDSIEKETENGKVIYDFEMKLEGVKWEADIQDDGTLLETEQEIKAKDAPVAVINAVKEKYPKGSIKEVMAKTKGSETKIHEYEVVVRQEAKDHEVTVAPDGKITEESAGEDEKDKDAADKSKDNSSKGKEKEEKEK